MRLRQQTLNPTKLLEVVCELFTSSEDAGMLSLGRVGREQGCNWRILPGSPSCIHAKSTGGLGCQGEGADTAWLKDMLSQQELQVGVSGQEPRAPFHQPCGMLQNHSSSLECPVPDWCMAQGVGRGEGSSWAVLALQVCRALLTTPRCCWRANHCFGADVTLRKQLQNCCPDPTTSQPLLLDGAGWAAARGSGMLPAGVTVSVSAGISWVLQVPGAAMAAHPSWLCLCFGWGVCVCCFHT